MELSEARALQEYMTQTNDGSKEPPLYMLIDAARDPSLYSLITTSFNEYKCLFLGDIPQELAEVSPYLMRLTHQSRFTDSLISKAWGNSWGVFFTSKDNFDQVYRHLRKFLKVKTSKHKSLFFRYYDPRVLRPFMQVCNENEIEMIFGPIQKFIMEDENPDQILQYTQNQNSDLIVNQIPLKKIFSMA